MNWWTHMTLGINQFRKPDGTIHDAFRLVDCIYQCKWSYKKERWGEWDWEWGYTGYTYKTKLLLIGKWNTGKPEPTYWWPV